MSDPASPTAAHPALPSRGLLDLLLVLGLALVYAAFGGMLSGEFVYDDLRLIAHNPRIAGTVGWWESLSTSHWGFDDPRAEGLVGYWRPLTVACLRLAYAAGGGRPFAFHLLSLALHMAASLVALRFFRRFLRADGLAYLAALLFALHPVHVESVAWISAMNDPLAGLLVLASLERYMAWKEGGARGAPLASALALFLGGLAKEQAWCGLLVLALIELLGARPEASSARPYRLRAALPYLVAALSYWGLRIGVFAEPLGGMDRVQAHFEMTPSRAISFRFELLGGFLALLAWPFRLAVFRPFRPVVPALDPLYWSALLAIGIFLALAALAYKKRLDRSLALLLAIPASLAPIWIRLGAAGRFPFSDRYLYFASAAYAAALVGFLARFLGARRTSFVVVPLALVYAARDATRIPVWHDELALFQSAVRETPRNPYVQWGLGRVLLDRYKLTKKDEDLDGAMLAFLSSLMLGHDYGGHAPRLPSDAPLRQRVAELEQAVHGTPVSELRPDPSVWVGLDDRLQANLGQGFCYLWYAQKSKEPDYDTPRLIFEQQTRTFPESYEAWSALGSVNVVEAELLIEAGRDGSALLDQALSAFGQALRWNPAYAEAWANQGRALVLRQDWESARTSYSKALEFRPGHLPYLLELAHVSIESGYAEGAARALAEARSIDPDSLQPLYLEGVLAASKNEWSEALARFDQVLARQKDHGLALLQRAKVLVRLGEMTEAVRSFAAACEVLPSSFEAHYNLARILMDDGQASAAEPYLVHAYEIAPPGPYRDDLALRLAPLVEGEVELAKHLVQVSRGRSDWNATLLWLHLVLVVENEWPEGHYLRGQALWRLERLQEARSSYERALELAPEHFWAQHDLGLMLSESKDYAAALPHLEAALAALKRPEIRSRIEPALLDAIGKALEGNRAHCLQPPEAGGH